jgi:hypothetical protein
MQLCGTIYCPLIALHVSSDIIAHHRELLNCIFTASGDILTALHVPSDIIAHHQELLNYFTASGDILIALHVPSDVIAQHQELLNCILQLLVIFLLLYMFRAILSLIIGSF